MKEDAARPRVDTVRGWGKAAKREAASLLLSRRPARVEAAALAVRRPFRRHVESAGAKDALRPTGRGRGAEGAPSSKSSGRSDQFQPPDGCPTGEGLTSNSNRRTWTEDEGPTSNFVVSARAACGELRQIRSGSNSLVGDLSESESSVRSDPGNRDRAPRFLWSETLVESQTVQPLLSHQRPDVKALGQSTPRSFTKLHGSSLEAGEATRRAISTKLRGSVSAEAHAFSALSACRRALSCAS